VPGSEAQKDCVLSKEQVMHTWVATVVIPTSTISLISWQSYLPNMALLTSVFLLTDNTGAPSQQKMQVRDILS